MTADAEFHAGFVSFVGRPNVGKSTLTNALVGEKIAITSSRPQTTRHAIRGIVDREDGQIVLVDTPGIHRPRTLLGERLNDVVQATLADVDVIGLCLPADEKIGPGDRYINAELDKYPQATLIAIVTKSETVSRSRLAQVLLEASQLREWAEIIPVSSVGGENVSALTDLLVRVLPASPRLYEPGQHTDERRDVRISELIRESVLELVEDELPHSVAVVVDEVSPRPDGSLTDVYATIVVERDSQKGIIIGRQGSMLRSIGQSARRSVEDMLGTRVFLKLHVAVRSNWQSSPKELGRLGF
ncbi:MAG TPA: GTPase Era [Pseudoclavibacter sp.]|nr:GTPase Era [Pseudoclavibacter sp.]